MFEKINDLTVSESPLGNEITLKGIFKDRINIVYGYNGSGKSTISRALADYAEWLADPDKGAELLKFDKQQQDELREKIYVYNEDFVDKNVKVNGGALESIVMLGEENIENDAKKEELKKEISKLKIEIAAQRVLLEGDAAQDAKSCEKQISEAENVLISKLKSAYASRGKNIKNIQRNIQVKLDDFNGIDKNPNQFEDNVTSIANQLNEGIKEIGLIQDGNPIGWKVTENGAVDIEKISQLLHKTIEMVKLDDERLEELAKTSRDTIEAAQHRIVDGNKDFCPYCQQPISEDWMKKLKEIINKVLNKDAEIFKNDLDATKASLCEMLLSCPDVVKEKFKNEWTALELALKNRNDFVGNLAQMLEEKKLNLYAVGKVEDKAKYEQLINEFNLCKEQLNQAVDRFNDMVNNKKKKEEELLKMNLWLAYLENKSAFEEIRKLKEEKEKAEDELNKLVGICANKESELQGLSNGAKDPKVAMNFINDCLKMVFADANRMKLKASGTDGKYKLTVRGADVPPQRVSTGERNILALSYFFAKISENTSRKNMNGKTAFIVIDDPVSSFDKGNQSGVLVLLKNWIESIFSNYNDKCKLLLLSHDRQVIISMEQLKKSVLKLKEDAHILQLCHNNNDVFLKKYEDRGSVYMIHLNQLFDFVISDDKDNPAFYGMGNILRQALESFAKLYNNSDCKEVLDNDFVWRAFDIRPIVKKDDYNDFFQRQEKLKIGVKDYLSRTVTNILSHSPNNPDVLIEESYFTPEELKKQIKYFFVFMTCVARSHAYGFLFKSPYDEQRRIDKKTKTEEWVRELFETYNS